MEIWKTPKFFIFNFQFSILDPNTRRLPPHRLAAEGGGFMFCNRVLCRPLLWAGAAFLISALIGSFWVSFLLGGLLLCLGILTGWP